MAWTRTLVVVAAVAVLASCGGGSSAKVVEPLALGGGLALGGFPVGNTSRTGVQIHFVENSLFGVGITFNNTSRTPVTVADATVVRPPQSIVRQVGTTLQSWNPRPCPPHVIGCLIDVFFRTPSDSARATPVVVKPGRQVAVQLDFRLGRCPEVPLASFEPVVRVDVAYRAGHGLQRQEFDLGGAALRLKRPPAAVCRPRPFSRLAIDGIFASSTASTIPSSNQELCSRTSIGSVLCEDADRCARTGAALSFRSGLFEKSDIKPASRIKIRLRRYRGTGRYLVGHGADVTTVFAMGDHGRTTYQAFTGSVTVDRVTSGSLEGHVQATLTGFRKQPFHTFGTWACTLGS